MKMINLIYKYKFKNHVTKGFKIYIKNLKNT